ncbi:tripartite tricarboxylate transporter substrate binding protein (plasmid) [Roseomonas sp. OT10]|uniref:Bug family tripartite tricarboxylate transporter substrate binding protein n=1 Tax=Roseomonas cutis TaxID=2897332 RepID=UPI001E4A283F|nr:tripartite tricarboxylate transporter substrate binding protein [Roseomonas sp. OT10]UFN51758.1 tripartite tricarboxylate transporter substrate binding protein [Roseomonas sp. OT10]
MPFTPGGSNDVVARLVAEQLSARWGQPIVVENRPGASGNIGAEAVARSAPDGYTWLLGANQIFTTNPHIVRGPFDVLTDFAYTVRLANVPVVLVTHPSVPARSLADLVALAKQKPGTLSYPSSGAGSFQHLGMARLVGEDAVHVPYRGANALMPDLLAGRVQVFAGAVNSLLPHIHSGALRAIALLGSTRTRLLPEVPTVVELGMPEAQTSVWLSIALPAGTPRPVIDKVYAGAADVIRSPEAAAKLAEQGIEPAIQSPDELSETVRSEFARDRELIARLNIRAD